SALLTERQRVSTRVKSRQSLSAELMHQYYSTWIPAAIHVLVMVPGKWTRRSIAERLLLPLSTVTEALELLKRADLVTEDPDGNLTSSSRRVHLKNDTSMIRKHHTNWRVRALHALDVDSADNIHYSGPIALSRANATILRGWLLELVERLEPLLVEPNEEDL